MYEDWPKTTKTLSAQCEELRERFHGVLLQEGCLSNTILAAERHYCLTFLERIAESCGWIWPFQGLRKSSPPATERG